MSSVQDWTEDHDAIDSINSTFNLWHIRLCNAQTINNNCEDKEEHRSKKAQKEANGKPGMIEMKENSPNKQ